jgi:hypothetical protein
MSLLQKAFRVIPKKAGIQVFDPAGRGTGSLLSSGRRLDPVPRSAWDWPG